MEVVGNLSRKKDSIGTTTGRLSHVTHASTPTRHGQIATHEKQPIDLQGAAVIWNESATELFFFLAYLNLKI